MVAFAGIGRGLVPVPEPVRLRTKEIARERGCSEVAAGIRLFRTRRAVVGLLAGFVRACRHQTQRRPPPRIIHALLYSGSSCIRLEWRNWQTHGTQNPATFTGHVGSTPTSSTMKTNLENRAVAYGFRIQSD
jgi:hypothetical protein